MELAQEKGASSWLTTRPLKEHHFVLHKRALHNALALRYGWSFKDETYTKSTLGVSQLIQPGEQKVFGLCWEVATDRICFGFTEIAQQLEPTKRNLVSTIGKFYDPLGYLAPIVISFKILFQSRPSRISMSDSLHRRPE